MFEIQDEPSPPEQFEVCIMQDIVGIYQDPNQVPEWRWVALNADLEHGKNGQNGTWEYALNLAFSFDDAPAALKPIIADAHERELSYLIVRHDPARSALQWYAINGGIPGEDETIIYVCQAASRENALAAFEAEMWQDEPEEKRDAMLRSKGHCVVVNSVVVSKTEILVL